MLDNNKIEIKIIDENKLEISNITDYLIENCKIDCTDVFGELLLISEFEIKPNEGKVFTSNRSFENVFECKITSNEKLIYQKRFNSECVIIISDSIDREKNCLNLIERLIYLSNIDIIKYNINYTPTYQNCKNITIELEDKVNKFEILNLSTELNYQKFIYLSNNLVPKNIDFINGLNINDEYPEFAKTDDYRIGEVCVKYFSIKSQMSNISTDCIFYNKKNSVFFEKVSSLISETKDIFNFQESNLDELVSCFIIKNKLAVKKHNLINTIENNDELLNYFNSNLSRKTGSLLKINTDIVNLCYEFLNTSSFESRLCNFYKKIKQTKSRKNETLKITSHCVGGAFVEVHTDSSRKFEVIFTNSKGETIYQTHIHGNMWTRLNKKFYQDYTVTIKEGSQVIYQEKFDLSGKRVYISLESSSLGDSLAWFPYVEEFRKKHKCEVIVSTFNNELFQNNYPDLTFIKPGEVANNLYTMYSIGWFYNDNGEPNYDKNPTDFRSLPLQKTASDILGLEFEEVRPKLDVPIVEKQKRVGIAIHGTAQSKYWNNPTGWQEVTDYLISLGYEVVIYSKEGDGYMGNNHPVGATKFPSGSLKELITGMASCEFFIGIGSGLSWLAWAINLPIVLISGFSEDYTETQTNTWRVINKNVCTGCFNTHKLDPSDWNWCPVNKGTNKQFECTKSITSQMVITEINNLIKLKCRSV